MAYASKYYDPVKAHEYYIKHRQLKGKRERKSTSQLNEAGKIAAKEVKEALLAEKKAILSSIRDDMQIKIRFLRQQLKGLSKEARKRRREEFKQAIADLRQEAKDKKAQVKSEYDEKYLQELDKIKADASMQKQKKGKKRKR